VSAIDGVSVTGAGGFPSLFFGTSAAAPHVAGIAALAAQGSPCVLGSDRSALDPVTARTALRQLIVGNATSLNGTNEPDNVSGSGRADAAASVQRTLPLFGGAASLTVDANSGGGATLTAAQLGSEPLHADDVDVDRRLRHGTGRDDDVSARDDQRLGLREQQRDQLLGAGRFADYGPLNDKRFEGRSGWRTHHRPPAARSRIAALSSS
jgi:subtilisin family serine protease